MRRYRARNEPRITIDHGVEIKDIRVGRVEAHQRLYRASIEFGAVVGRIEQLTVQIAIDDARGNLPDLADM
jgi:hypothetical protein